MGFNSAFKGLKNTESYPDTTSSPQFVAAHRVLTVHQNLGTLKMSERTFRNMRFMQKIITNSVITSLRYPYIAEFIQDDSKLPMNAGFEHIR